MTTKRGDLVMAQLALLEELTFNGTGKLVRTATAEPITTTSVVARIILRYDAGFWRLISPQRQQEIVLMDLTRHLDGPAVNAFSKIEMDKGYEKRYLVELYWVE